MDIQIDTITCGDCLQVMPFIKDKSINLILSDLPYGTTACKWDQIIPFEPLWKEYKRLIKDDGAIVLTASQPFTSALVMSNPGMFKYCWIWEKSIGLGFLHAKNKPIKVHEDIAIFSPGTTVHASQSINRMTYNPQGLIKVDAVHSRPSLYPTEHNYTRPSHKTNRIIEFSGYPKSVLKIPNGNNKNLHPTQKPVALFEYLIKTYTNEGDLVLDNAAGSGTTAIAALNCNRHYILIEKDPKYCEISRKRISALPTRLSQWEDKPQ